VETVARASLGEADPVFKILVESQNSTFKTKKGFHPS
jgi:hypothetical protein